jgi:hypothetical protein
LNDEVEEDKMGRACSMHLSEGECIQGFGGKVGRKNTTRRSRRRLEDNIKMDLREIEWGGMEWINLAKG